jgi:hypothetical protein
MKKSKMMKKALYTYCSKQPPLMKKGRGRHLKRCTSVIAIMLRHDFAGHNAFVLYRIFIDCNSYRSEHIGPVIASYSYCSDVIGHRCRISTLLLLEKIALKNKYNRIPVGVTRKKYTQN